MQSQSIPVLCPGTFAVDIKSNFNVLVAVADILIQAKKTLYVKIPLKLRFFTVNFHFPGGRISKFNIN